MMANVESLPTTLSLQKFETYCVTIFEFLFGSGAMYSLRPQKSVHSVFSKKIKLFCIRKMITTISPLKFFYLQ
jgi:hypothetical protein